MSVGVGVGVGVFVGVSVGVFVGVSVGVFVGVSVGVFVGVSVGVFVGAFVGVSVGVVVGVLVDVRVGVGVAWITSSAPIHGFVGLRESLSKSFVMPVRGFAAVLVIGVPAPAAGLVFRMCRSTVAAVPFGLMNCGSAEMLFAS